MCQLHRPEQFAGKINHRQKNNYELDLVIGGVGFKSVVCRVLFLDVEPCAPTTDAAYRAVILRRNLHLGSLGEGTS